MSVSNELTTHNFGSDGTASPEAQAQFKLAQEDLFRKLASANGVDLNKLSNTEVMELWNRFYTPEGQKQASAAPDLQEQARAEHAVQQEKIAREQEAWNFGLVQGEAVWAVFAKHAAEAGMFPFAPKKDEEKKDDKGSDKDKKDEKKDEKEKKASAFDGYVHDLAMAMAKEASLQLDFDILSERVKAACVLVPSDNPHSKVANVRGSFEDIARTRALELLELAGLTVNWDQ